MLTISLSAADITIREINFNGLIRTKEHIALQIVRPVEIGSPFSNETEGIIIQELREAGIFNPEITTEVIIQENEAFIEVFLKDRWTLIPIPIFSFSQNGAWKAGVLGIESNLLGYYKTLGVGLFIGSEGWSLLSFFSDNIFLGTDLKFGSSITLGLNEITDENVQEETIRNYQVDETGFGMSLEYPFSEEFSLKGGGRYDRSVLRPESAVQTGIPDMQSAGLFNEIIWKDLYYGIPYNFGLLAKAEFNWNWGFEDTENYTALKGKVNWSLNPIANHLLVIGAVSGWSRDNPVQQQFRLGGEPGSLVLPVRRIAADEYSASSAAYNVPLWFFPGGTLSIKGFYEVGYYKSDIVERTLFHGPGTGLEIFIDNLAIPAIQMNIAWNLETGRYQFSAGVGMGGGD
ncbi:hypothetical protein [Oceanispirochaeta sp.]|uniref:BamA/TamA family outer membrane protein n=1 Tax=Oceanispirochaeta sp. TaxID=2035350 RepID=UPI002631A820|nr:hypothetical protein [Oceanispirochaeta sp.]MDA3957296.1 hypothetical protein [Oceanispirochaeta sp.]